MLAGNMASISRNRQMAAATRVGGNRSPTAPSSSSTPVMATSRSGDGSGGGTIAIMSRRMPGVKCATPVMKNIRAKPTAMALGQLST